MIQKIGISIKENVWDSIVYSLVGLAVIGVVLGRFYFNIIGDDVLTGIIGGFFAQVVDGALGMAYGVTSTTILLNSGIAPAAASASVHTAEIFTTGASGISHLKFGNVNKKLFKSLVLPGMVGALLGSLTLVWLENEDVIGNFLAPIVSGYTLILGIIILRKAFVKRTNETKIKRVNILAVIGGYLDSVGGGGWGPVVTTTLISRGRDPIYSIGSVNLAEFFVSVTSSFTFIVLIGLNYTQIVLGLIIGGLVAAPFAARIARKIPIKPMTITVGVLVIFLSLRKLVKAFGII